MQRRTFLFLFAWIFCGAGWASADVLPNLAKPAATEKRAVPKTPEKRVAPAVPAPRKVGLLNVRTDLGLIQKGTPVGVLWSDQPDRALRRFLQVRDLAPMEMVEPMVRKFLAKVGPMLGKNPPKDTASLVKQLPALLGEMGLDLSQPVAAVLVAQGNAADIVFSMGIHAGKLAASLKKWRLPLRVVSFLPNVSILMSPMELPVAVIWGDRLYMLGGKQNPKALLNQKSFGKLLDYIFSKSTDAEHLATSLLADRPCPVEADVCGKFSLERAYEQVTPSHPAVAVIPYFKRFFRGAMFTADMREGLRAEQRVVLTEAAKPLLGVLRADTNLASWFSMLPITTGWFSRLHLSPKGIRELLTFAEKIHPMAKMGVARFRMQLAKAEPMFQKLMGVELKAVLRGFRGDIAAGFLWEDEIAHLFKNIGRRRPRFFPGHLRGFYAAVGFNSITDARRFSKLLERAWGFAAAKDRRLARNPKMGVHRVNLFGQEALEIRLPRMQPFYVANVQRFLYFFGHRSTFEKFAAVWQGKAPSFAAVDTIGANVKRGLDIYRVKGVTASTQPAAQDPKAAPAQDPKAAPAKDPKAAPAPSTPSVVVKGVKAPAPHALRNTFPGLYDFALMGTSSSLVIHPRVIRDLAEWLVPPMAKHFARKTWSNLRLVGVYDLVEATDYVYGWSVAFAPIPLVSAGVLGATCCVACSFPRDHSVTWRESESSHRAKVQCSIDLERSDFLVQRRTFQQHGRSCPRHFPKEKPLGKPALICAEKVVTCSPTPLPCRTKR
ncbi:MAG: hypothetical protein H6728_16155 [Myxococcales bacterium]|nr:hypothetical protein [Myxococcales bacterium]